MSNLDRETVAAIFLGKGYSVGEDGLPYLFKRQGRYEITIEFCIGDMCVGAFVGEDYDLIEPKIRCHSLEEVLSAVEALEVKYFLSSLL